jgi:LPXTG-site transpeptidase (sortase) family protein
MDQKIKLIIWGLIVALALSSVHPIAVQAAVILDSSLVQPVIANTFSVAQEQSGDYLEPTNSYNDGSPTYFFVTRDATKAGTANISYNGETFSVTTLVSNGDDLSSLADSNGKILRANVTIFFDAGTYNDSDSTNYYGFSKTNLSLVGLTAGTVIISRSPDIDGKGVKTMERTGFQNSNIYLENLIFDGGGINMVAGSRGEFFFYMAIGSANFVMKNCVIQNVGASSSGLSNKNVAINFYQSYGQHNFENVTFKNIKTQLNYGIISFNDSKENYFKNITIRDDDAYASSTYSIKIEHTVTSVPITEISNIFTGTLSLPTDSNHSFVYIQNFNYGKTILPSAFRYAQYKNINGGSSSSAIQVYQSVLPDVTANRGILDLNDNSWLVQAANSRSISSQLADILAVRTGMNSAGALAKWPNPNIKISAASNGEIGSFSIPAFSEPVNIVAIPFVGDLFSNTVLVPFSAAGILTLTANSHLFNFDFHSKANYTLAEAISHRGLNFVTLSDPYESGTIGGYPTYSTYGYSTADVSPIFTNASASSFGNCRFTSLANEIEIAPPTSTSVGLGYTLQLNAALKNSDTNSFTGNGFSGVIKDTADDQTISWYSSDPSIASVDKNTGMVTALAIGPVSIIAKANDAYNQGEIEKPYAVVNLTVRAQSHLFSMVASSNLTRASRKAQVVFTFTIRNTGFDPNPNTVFTDSVPATFDILDVTTDRGTTTVSGNDVAVNIGTLGVGENVIITITTEVNNSSRGNTVVINSASVSAMGGVAVTEASVSVEIIGSSGANGENDDQPIPLTGFAPGVVAALPVQNSAYTDLGSLWLEIPVLGVSEKIVGVPQTPSGWDVSWLGNDIGWLNGTAWPSWSGNAVLTAHNYGADGLPGPFVNLASLKWDDEVILHTSDDIYTYEVREVLKVTADDLAAVTKHEDLPWLTLVTCSGYDENSGAYLYRVVVRAVLVKKE